MMSRGHVLYFILLPVLAQVSADDTDDQIMSEVMNGEQDTAARAGLERPPSHNPLPLPPALLLQLLQSSQLPRGASASALPSSPSSSEALSLSNPHTTGRVSSSEYDDDDDDDEEGDNNNSNNNNGEVRKRVFCNGFTGCGGRHRDRSRRQRYGKRLIPLLVKRPFCNSFGCYNGKRSSPSEPVDNVRARTLARLLAAAARHQQETGLVRVVGSALGKRLFCNGYGGCRGGKRSLFSPWISKMNGVVGSARR